MHTPRTGGGGGKEGTRGTAGAAGGHVGASLAVSSGRSGGTAAHVASSQQQQAQSSAVPSAAGSESTGGAPSSGGASGASGGGAPASEPTRSERLLASAFAAAINEAGVAVRLTPVRESGGKEGARSAGDRNVPSGKGAAGADEVGGGDVLASTAGSHWAGSLAAAGGSSGISEAAMGADMLRSSMQGVAAAAARAAKAGAGANGGAPSGDPLRASAKSTKVSDLLRRSDSHSAALSGAASAAATATGEGGDNGAPIGPDYAAAFADLQRLVCITEEGFLDGMAGEGDGSGRAIAALE
ncbi:hypothetical protein FOA52_010241 [Chlamydomonas sp. UWO 241]|nr:hypothetical protein FOA52_010241 [Chlamydomonas sp. UWO 241]